MPWWPRWFAQRSELVKEIREVRAQLAVTLAALKKFDADLLAAANTVQRDPLKRGGTPGE